MTETSETPRKKTPPKWETDARNNIRAAVRRYSHPLADLIERDANEGDTRLLVTDMLCEGLGYDKFENLTTEYMVRGEFADYGLRVDKQLVAFIEVKRCTTKLGAKHLRQVQMYAVNEGVEWMVLTNGAVWQAWHLSPGMPVTMDMVMEVNLLGEEGPAAKADLLYYLSRQSFQHKAIDELWKIRSATSPRVIAAVIMAPAVVEQIRRELWRQTGHRMDIEKLRQILQEVLPGS